jgi:hypothetical protein
MDVAVRQVGVAVVIPGHPEESEPWTGCCRLPWLYHVHLQTVAHEDINFTL